MLEAGFNWVVKSVYLCRINHYSVLQFYIPDYTATFMRSIPHIKGVRLAALLPKMLGNLPDTLSTLAQQYQGIVKMGYDTTSFIFIDEPEYIKHILKTNVQNYSRGKSAIDLKPMLGNGIFISNEEDWKRQRQAVSPAFHSKFFSDFNPIIADEVLGFTIMLRSAAKAGQAVNISYQVKRLAARISYRTMFIDNKNIDIDTVLPTLDRVYEFASFYHHTIREAISLVFGKHSRFTKNKKTEAAFTYLHNFSEQILVDGEVGNHQVQVFLQTLIDEMRAGSVSREEVVDQIKNIVFAGYDTVGESLSWIWYCLAAYKPEVSRARDEINRVCNGRMAGMEDFQNLPYLLMFVKEAMRIFPVVWAFHRMAVEDDIIDGYEIKKKDWVIVSPYVIHRNAKYWSVPMKFDPMRFEGEANMVPVRYDYLPFGQGPHTCLGNRLAMFEIQLILSLIIPAFEFDYTGTMPAMKSDILLRQKNPMYMNVKEIRSGR